MDDSDWQIDVESELAPLKGFQRRTVDNAFARLYGDTDPVDSFLVADEVGLGKTLVARGVIARAVDHILRIEGRSQARILYVCSNAQIARQNLPKLMIGPSPARAEQSATRLTLMPTAPSSQRLTFTAFTPGTSISFGDQLGQSGERVRLYLLLKRAGIVDGSTARSRQGWRQFLRGWSGVESFSHQISSAQDRGMWEGQDEQRLAETLLRALDGGITISGVGGPDGRARTLTTSDLIGIADDFRGTQSEPDGELATRRGEAIVALRRSLAWLVAASFRPDLVVLDEFQRFKDLLPDPASEDAGREETEFSRRLMAMMLGRQEGDQRPSRMLLLSATPYRMYTQGRDAEGDDHYDDFIATVRALADGRTTAPLGHPHCDSVEAGLAQIRSAMRFHDLDAARQGRDWAQRELRRVMSRTERLAATPDRDGMLTTVDTAAGPMTAADVADYVSLRAVARSVGSYDPMELWRSAPHTLAMMDERTRYDMDKRIHRVLRPDADGLAQQALAAPGVCALRALAGVEAGEASEKWSEALRMTAIRGGALRIGWAMLRLFDRAEIQAAVWAGFQMDHGGQLAEEDPESRSQAYLRAVLDQCLAGDLDAVLPEYLHQIGEAVGMFESGHRTDAMTRVVDEVVSALTIKTANQQLRPLTVQDGEVMEAEPEKMPCRFALRYGDAAATDQAENRSEVVRTAFNSPFWPFVLATTSAGQEGIDFHRYCRCVVHWNLPSNPVDLEQREGRVHRYKCLAVRQNVASTWGPDARVWRSQDPWETVFRIAEEAVASSGADDEMRPLWVWSPDIGDGVRIERRILPLPFSREQGQYRHLVRMLGSYRMAFGQPRQEELLAVLGHDALDNAEFALSTLIDLTPGPTDPPPQASPAREGSSSAGSTGSPKDPTWQTSPPRLG